MIELLQTIDEAIVMAVNGWNTPFADSVMWWVSGKFSWWPFYLFLIVFLFYRRTWKEAGLILLLTIALVTLADQSSVHLFKETIQRLRPSHNPEIKDLLHLVNGYRGGSYGFLSSHAANSFAVAGLLAFIFRKKWFSILLYSWAGVVSFSRLYLGVHYLSDLLAGAAWGLILAYSIYRLYLWIFKRYGSYLI